MIPKHLLDCIATWRNLNEVEQVSRLRKRVVGEVIGNMHMEGQPVSAEWETLAKASN